MISLNDQILENAPIDYARKKKPAWLRSKLPGGKEYQQLRGIVDDHALHTVCESARCPNMGECWARGTATLMILGDVCTRSCGFCHINTGKPPLLDLEEPERVGHAAALMRLKHLVITSVNRDELPDGGAAIWAETIREIRTQSPGTSVEVLIPDFCGDWDALQTVLDAKPDILNHNMETVRRLYKVVRPQAKYEKSIELLRRAKEQGFVVKTGIMVGIGERDDEIEQLMHDVVEGVRPKRAPGGSPVPTHERSPDDAPAPPGTTLPHGAPGSPRSHPTCDILTVGQYLQPTRDHLPITRWVTPEQFEHYKERGEAIGFRHVESGPLVRSSYHAEEQVLQLD